MKPRDWPRIEELYHAALERPLAERGAFLDGACGGDQALRHEVQSLLAAERDAERLMEEPALGAATQKLAVTRGTRLGPYEVTDLVGAGGMGEIYRARDTRLGREVAIKVLPEHVAHDPDALARFGREARAVAALSHPHPDEGPGRAVAAGALRAGELGADRPAVSREGPRGALPVRARRGLCPRRGVGRVAIADGAGRGHSAAAKALAHGHCHRPAPPLLAAAGIGLLYGRKLGERPFPKITQLTFRRGLVDEARFTADGKTVVYSAFWDGNPPEIFTTRVGSRESRSLGLPAARLLSLSSRDELAILLKAPGDLSYGPAGTLARVPLSGGRAPEGVGRRAGRGLFARRPGARRHPTSAG
jgi:hypothetical protein